MQFLISFIHVNINSENSLFNTRECTNKIQLIFYQKNNKFTELELITKFEMKMYKNINALTHL